MITIARLTQAGLRTLTTHAFVVALATAVPAAVIIVAADAAATDKDGCRPDRSLRTAAHARPRSPPQGSSALA